MYKKDNLEIFSEIGIIVFFVVHLHRCEVYFIALALVFLFSSDSFHLLLRIVHEWNLFDLCTP